jgi:threonylcarbamoyladenosine tRNA methylthiotransferase MtaB
MDVYLATIGCRLNEAELQGWRRTLDAAGHRVVNSPEAAELVVFNTCAVTAEAARKSRKLASRLHRLNPMARMVLTGCFAEIEPETTAELAGVDLVINNHDKSRLLTLLNEELGVPTECDARRPIVQTAAQRRTRAFVKVQDGCRNRCTFCIVTIARGEERSRPLSEIVEEIQELHAQGLKEVVLTGVHLGGYGSDTGSDLRELVETVLARTSIERVRISSLEPWDVPSGFFELWSDERLCQHLHLPLQSGSDPILRRMARRCDTADYRDLVAAARRSINDLVLTTDIIVGFPGESAIDWQRTLDFCREMSFAHIHIFNYSPREGTAAAKFADSVSPDVKRARSRQLHQLAGEMKRSCLSKYVGSERLVLWEGNSQAVGDGERLFSGLTDNYLRCETTVPEGIDLENTLVPARLVGVEHDRLRAEIR